MTQTGGTSTTKKKVKKRKSTSPSRGKGTDSTEDSSESVGSPITPRSEGTSTKAESTEIATKRQVLERFTPVPPPAKPAGIKEGDIVTYDDGAMKGRVVGLSGKNVIIEPTHVEGEPIDPSDLQYHTTNGKTQSWPATDVRLETPATIQKVPTTGVDITHFHTGEKTASEFVTAHGDGDITAAHSIEITNHGLGSGIYGFANATPEQISEAASKYNSTAYTVHMNNPLFLQDDTHGAQLTELSKTMQRVASAFRTARTKGTTATVDEWAATQPDLNTLKTKLVSLLGRAGVTITPESAEAQITGALKAFFTAYDSTSAGQLVAQPVNFLLNRLGYDGVYATDKVNNAFNRGNVAYTVPPGTSKTGKSDRLLV